MLASHMRFFDALRRKHKRIPFYATVSLSMAWWNPGLKGIKYLFYILFNIYKYISNHNCRHLLALELQTIITVWFPPNISFFIYTTSQKFCECFMILKGLLIWRHCLTVGFAEKHNFFVNVWIIGLYFVSANYFLLLFSANYFLLLFN